jgi:glycosyltransferase involved in cell wall biosynthesis
VLHVVEAVGAGTLRHVADLVGTVKAEHHVACPVSRAAAGGHPDPTGLLMNRGATVHPLAMSPRLGVSTALAVPRLHRLVSRLQPDVVHGHASVGGVVARAGVARRVPVIWTPHALSDRPWVVRVERALRPRPDVIVALSDSEARSLEAAGLANASRMELVPNGISESPAQESVPSRTSLGLPGDARVVGFIGRMQPQKAPFAFLEVARRVLEQCDDVHVLAVGSGTLLEEVLDRAARLLPGERFHHVVQDADADSLLGVLDVLVVPSRYEGGPYLPLEAMAAGIPVVATRVRGLSDYVVHGVSGLTAPVDDYEGLANHVVSLLDSPTARTELAASARRHVAQAHSLEAMARRYEQLYAGLVVGLGAPRG